MKTSRRGFLGALLALPVVGPLLAKFAPPPTRTAIEVLREYESGLPPIRFPGIITGVKTVGGKLWVVTADGLYVGNGNLTEIFDRPVPLEPAPWGAWPEEVPASQFFEFKADAMFPRQDVVIRAYKDPRKEP